MKTILNSRRDRYLAKFSIFLITVALVAGMVGCGGDQYDLTISSGTGGNVTATVDGEKTVIGPDKTKTVPGIANGTVVNLVATTDPGYRFLKWHVWMGDVRNIADVNAAETTITMNTTYSIEAEFVWGLEIRDWYHLNATRTSNNLGGSHIMMNDLNSTTPGYQELASPTANEGKGWEPIGTFTGSFDGKGYKIRDLFINRPDATGVGLFSVVVDKGGVVQNVTVVNANVTGKRNVGGLVGENYGTVSSSNSTGSVNGTNDYVGGLVGWNVGTVSNSTSTGSVSGDSWVGGLVGSISEDGTVSNSASTGSVSGNSSVGGLVGWNEGKVENNSYSSSTVTGSEYVGGLAGWNQGTVSNSNSTGNVTGSNKYVGGLVGWNQGTVSASNSTGSVIGSDEHVGGLVGWNQGTVQNSYSSSNVTGTNKHVGGLVGWNEGTVSNSTSTGSVTGGSRVGGLVGWNEKGGKVENSYSSSNVTGSNNYVGGLVGWNENTVTNSTSTGSVTGKDDVGGLVGWNQGTVQNSYSTGSVADSNDDVGGLVGYNKGGTVENSYSTGNVSGHECVGGLVGYMEGGFVIKSYSTGRVTGARYLGGLVAENNKGTVSNSFWDIQTSGRDPSPKPEEYGTGKNTTEMKNITTFKAAGWTIIMVAPGQTIDTYTWNIENGVTYPFLSWQS